MRSSITIRATEAGDPDRRERDRVGGEPSLLRADRQGVEQDRHRRCRTGRTRRGRIGRGLVPRLLQPDERQHDRHGTDRSVDEEDPVPRHGVDEDAAEHRPDRRRDHRDAEHADRGLGAIFERVGAVQHRRADRRDEAGADALQDTEHDQLLEGLRQPAGERRDDERDQRQREHPFGAEPVAEPAGGRDHGGVGEQVADGDPLDVGGRHAEVLRHRRQGDVDHRAVDDRHEQPHDVDGHHLRRVRHRCPNLRATRSLTRPER